MNPNFFKSTPKLESVFFIRTIFRKLPDKLFCSLPLRLLHLIGNRVTKLDEIGCGENNTCCAQLLDLRISENNLANILEKDLHFPELFLLDLSFNEIISIQDGSLNPLTYLELLNLDGNQLSSLPENLFQNNLKLKNIFLSQNRLTILPKTLFSNLFHLEILDLSVNKIITIDQNLFAELYSLLGLDLSNNNLTELPTGFTTNLPLLQNLSVSENFLTKIEEAHLQGLQSLNLLNLSQNSLEEIAVDAFKQTPNLSIIYLDCNKLSAVPNFSFTPKLIFIDLSTNILSGIKTEAFAGLKNLLLLYLENNNITYLGRDSFQDLSTLYYLNLNNNSISNFEKGTLEFSDNLYYLFLSDNHIETFSVNFLKVRKGLYLKNNKIRRFDFSLLNENLQELDLSGNQIEAIEDPWGEHLHLNLKRFAANDNRMQKLIAPFFPPKLEVILLARNNISEVLSFSLNPLPRLFSVDLEENAIQEMEYSQLRYLYPKPITEPMPEFHLLSNPLICSCKNFWIQSAILGSDPRHLPHLTRVLSCRLVYRRLDKVNIGITEINSENFVCAYEEIATIFDRPLICPPQCRCYHDHNYVKHIIDCQKVVWDRPLPKVPYRATTLFLDGNENLESTAETILANLTLLEHLYMNGSQLTRIKAGMFADLANLRVLYLHDNRIATISADNFLYVPNLQNLTLHNNDLRTLGPKAFLQLSYLATITLHINKLNQPHLWNATNKLTSLTLKRNPISCDCDYALAFQKWAAGGYVTHFSDIDEVYCDSDERRPIMQYNDTSCFQSLVFSDTKGNITLVLSTVLPFIFLTTIAVLIYLYRLEMQVWIYSRYGLRFFRGNEQADLNKKYDAFVSYSTADDQWVAGELVPRLKDYRLCLHQRDFPVGDYITDSIVDAVENSCRTLLILTPRYLESEWCRFEFQTAHFQALKDKCRRLIVIILEEVNRKELDKEMQAYLNTNTYLDSEDNLFWEKLKFALPDLKREEVPVQDDNMMNAEDGEKRKIYLEQNREKQNLTEVSA